MKIAILGAGLMGRVLALRLYQSGYNKLTLIDKDTTIGENSPAFIAAGMLAPFSESVMGGKLIYELGKNSLTYWHQYLDSLGAPTLCSNQGTILLTNQNFATEITHYLKKISFNIQLTGKYYSHLNSEEISKLEPDLTGFNYGYYLPGEGSLYARKVFGIIGDYLLTCVNWITETCVNEDSFSSEICINGKKQAFDLIFDCRGLGAKNILSDLRGVRGEIIRVSAPDVNINRPIRIFHPRHNIYVTPYEKNYYIIGATEIEAEDYSPISVRSSLELLSIVYSIHKGFAEARILEAKTNCRPTLKSNEPLIMAKDNHIVINGLYRHGFLLAPTLAENIITYLKDRSKLNPEIWS